MQRILQNHPDLLLQFQEALPDDQKPNPTDNYSVALEFVHKVKNQYQNDEETYQMFLSLLREFERGGRTQPHILKEIENLLHKSPELVGQFRCFVSMKKTDSSDTLNSISNLEETAPLLTDLEGKVVQSKNFSLLKWILVLLCLALVCGISFALKDLIL